MDDKIREQIQNLFALYTENLPKKIHSIQMNWQLLCEDWNVAKFVDFHREVHSFCGSSGTYGYLTLSNMARKLEVYLKPLLGSPEMTSQQRADITHLVNGLQMTPGTLPEENSALVTMPKDTESNVIYILDHNKLFVTELAIELEQVGYYLQDLQDFSELIVMLKKTPPAGIVIDLNYLDESNAQTLQALRKQYDLVAPLICLASSGDLPLRLRAIRAGSAAFLQRPLDTFYLTRTLTQLCGFATIVPYRILIVDDSVSLAEYYGLILQEAGMITQVISNPLRVIEAITEFQPDLLLLDIYMPECSGLELAAVLRQATNYTHIPIIFLSSEIDKIKQIAALSLGGDDFLTKPILPQHLVAAVKSRAKRAETLSSFINRDSLTGLLNHTNILYQLEVEILRMKRSNSSLVFAMIDIDNFKVVNDQCGHLVGDRVIKKLSELLVSRLRKTDYVGRYGGEEFAIILPNTTVKDGQEVLDQLREKFSQIQFGEEGAKLQVTFSVGIASFPLQQDYNQMIEAADRALYRAKQNGRNQIDFYSEILIEEPTWSLDNSQN